MPKYLLILLLALFSLSLFSVEWPNPIPIRQGVNIEWFRTGTETADGGAVYVWSDTKLGGRDLYAQKVDAAGNMVWGQPLLVDGKIDRQEDPVITRTSDNNFFIAWIDFSDDLDGNVYCQKVSSAGQLMWQTGGVPVCLDGSIQISLNCEPDNAGGAYLVWEDSRNPGKDLYGQHLSSTGTPLWTVNGAPVANAEGDESYNTMWADGTGGFIIGYVYSLSGSETLLVKRFLPNGQMAWTQPLVLSPSPAVQNKIKMSPIDANSFVFTWMDFRNLDPDIYAQRIDLNGNLLWPDPFIVYTDSTATVPVPQENPRVVQTNDNSVIVVWEDKRNDQDDPDLFAQKISLNGTRQWDVNGVPVAVAPFAQVGPRMAADENGGCYVCWDDARNGNSPNIDIYAQHLSAQGATLWLANGQAVCTAPNEQSGSLLKVANNNIFINWMDMRDGSVGIDYQVFNASGTALLTNDGIQVFWGLSGDATLKQVVHLPRQHDSVVLWQDTRFANLGYQIFFQIIHSDGTVALETNGRPVTTLTGFSQSNPAAVVLPDNKIAVVWEEKRTDNPKIFAQLLSANGDRLWGDQGIALTESEPLRQKDPRISYADGALYIGWSNLDNQDTPTGTRQLFHIYGQKIVGNDKQWGVNGKIISNVPTADPYFETSLETLVDKYYVWKRTSVRPETFGATNIWAKLVNDAGDAATGWSDYGVVTSNYNNDDLAQNQPNATITDSGLFVAWLDFRGDFIKNLYGQMISTTGQILWDPSGVNLDDFGREQDEFTLLGGSNVTFSWKESQPGDNQDVAIQRYSLLGEPLWGPQGFFVVQRDSTQSSPNLARFQSGRMAVAWEDSYGESPDIMVRYINDDGTPDAYPYGVPVCRELMIQQYPIIAVFTNPNTNRAIITWSDGRSSGKTPIFGLYAQEIRDSLDAVSDDHGTPSVYFASLYQNQPNPFYPDTKISFNLKHPADHVELAVYNLKGQKVNTLYNGKSAKGTFSFAWNGKDANDRQAAAGVYFYRLKVGSQTLTRKMVLMH